LRYLTALLNSKLIAFWLRKKGKMQGTSYQLDNEPLSEIPIHQTTIEMTNKIVNLVNDILIVESQGGDSTKIEIQIVQLVYQIYEVIDDEKGMIEV
jgi:adenine-specific DNA-methyltransferase